jgi:uncharacterized membrane protein
MNNKIGLFFVLCIAVFAFVAADTWDDDEADIKEMLVYYEEELVWEGYCDEVAPDDWECWTDQVSTPAFERGEEAEIKVVFESNIGEDDDPEQVSVRTWLTGYKDDIEDETSEFDVYAGKTYIKRMYLEIPEDTDATEDYTLRVEVESQQQLSGVSRANIDALVQLGSNELEIKYIELYGARDYCSCNYEQISKGLCGECYAGFEAGSHLCVDVTVKNRGSQDIDDVYLNVNIDELCVFRSTYVGDLESKDCGDEDDDCEDSATETVCFTIPAETKMGTYEMEIEAVGDDAEDSVSQMFTVGPAMVEKPTETKVDIMLQQTSATIEQGKGAVYSLFVANLGSEETFVVSVEGIDGWATAQVNPMVFTLGEGESKTVNVYIAANEDAAVAQHVFTVKVKYGDSTKVYNMNADVTGKTMAFSGLDLKTILMVIAIILAIIIVILLIVLLAKRNSKEKTEETYY